MSNIGTARVCPKCGNTYIVGVEYAYGSPERYDGISEYYCPLPEGAAALGGDEYKGCGYREGRWSGKELKPGEVEKRYGGKH